MTRIATLAVIAGLSLACGVSTQVASASAKLHAGEFCSHTRSPQARYRRAGFKCVYRRGHWRLVATARLALAGTAPKPTSKEAS